MKELFDRISAEGFEDVVFSYNADTGLETIIAVHDTTLGPALGGVRMYPYASEEAAIHDVLRLSRGMTYKAATAEVGLGGGKAVILGDPTVQKSPELLESFGAKVHQLHGRYISTVDSGTTPKDMDIVRRKTTYVVGYSPEFGGSGDPSPVTALGCFIGIKACLEYVRGSDSLKGIRVAMQGVGQVGHYLLDHLIKAEATVIATDTNPERIGRAREMGAQIVDQEEIYSVEADVFSPNAFGGTINKATIQKLKAPIIAGGANNQLESEEIGRELANRGIVYAPDYVINAGGLINVWAEYYRYPKRFVDQKLAQISQTLKKIFDISRAEKLPTGVIGERLAEEKIKKRKSR